MKIMLKITIVRAYTVFQKANTHCIFTVMLVILELRRLYANLIMCYKIVFELVNLTFSDFFAFSPSTATRGHQYKIYVNHS